MDNNENEIQKNDIITDMYKDKLTKRENNKLNVEQNNKLINLQNLNLLSLQEIDQAPSSQFQSSNNGSPILSPKEGKKRRIGIWFQENNILNKDDKENNNQFADTSPNLINEEKDKNKDNKSILLTKLKNFEYSLKGYFIMICVIFISIFFYDIKMICFNEKYHYIYNIFYIITIIYYLFDICIRTLLNESLSKTFYFWIDFFGWLIMILDFDEISYPFLQIVIYGKKSRKRKYIPYEEQIVIEIALNIIQNFRFIRIIKFYHLFSDFLKEKENNHLIQKYIQKLENKIKFPQRAKQNRNFKQSNTLNKESQNNMNNTSTLPFQSPSPHPIFLEPTKSKRATLSKNSFFTVNSTTDFKKKVKQLKNILKNINKVELVEK